MEGLDSQIRPGLQTNRSTLVRVVAMVSVTSRVWREGDTAMAAAVAAVATVATVVEGRMSPFVPPHCSGEDPTQSMLYPEGYDMIH